ncbi:MAG TPA: O-antigen ligase domain-containing protein [Myxococcales bacterium]|nr:O-antigen ligase domain-containing protein [Myxococcales bacterium]
MKASRPRSAGMTEFIRNSNGLRIFFDISLLCLTLSTFYFGTSLQLVVLFFILAPFLIWPKLGRENFSQDHALFLFFFGQYVVLHLLKAAWIDTNIINSSLTKEQIDKVIHWEIWALVLILGVASLLRFCSIKQLGDWFHRYAPVVLFVGFLAMSFGYFARFFSDYFPPYVLPYLETHCRIKNQGGTVFVAPLLFTVFAIMLFQKWQNLSVNAKRTRHILVGLAVISSTAYGGTRGIFIAQILSFSVLGLLLLWFDRGRGARDAASLVLAVCAGVAVGGAFDSIVGCGFFQRVEVMTSLMKPDLAFDDFQGIEGGIALRVNSYQRALEVFAQRPLLGHGIAAEYGVAAGGLTHVHNIYLSWMIWGGVVSLISGIVFLLSAGLALLRRRRTFGSCVLGLSVAGPFLFSQLFDSFLFFEHFLLLAMLVLTLSVALGTQEEEESRA